MGTFEEINSEWEDGSEEIVQNVTQRQRNGNMSDAKRDKSTSGWHLQSGRTLTPCTFWRVRWWARGHLRQCITWIYREEPEWGGILQNKDPAILNRRKITSEEGLRCRNEWPTTKATKVTSVDEALTKLLGENSECVGFVRFNAVDGRWEWFPGVGNFRWFNWQVIGHPYRWPLLVGSRPDLRAQDCPRENLPLRATRLQGPLLTSASCSRSRSA